MAGHTSDSQRSSPPKSSEPNAQVIKERSPTALCITVRHQVKVIFFSGGTSKAEVFITGPTDPAIGRVMGLGLAGP